MCGLVGIAGDIVARDVSLFSQMLLADELRGKHATGIARIIKDSDTLRVGHAKLAISASFFRHLPIFDMITKPSVNLTALLGHNRHATKGASDSHQNAHPFKHGNITLMHNGSLTSHHNLTKGHFTVDSEAICAAFQADGAMEVIPKLRGAFALVWADEEAQTLSFVRNSERPLHIAFHHKTNKMYWASEKNMLIWLLERDMTFVSGGFDYDEIVELPIGEVWTFPLKSNSANLTERVITPVTLATTYSYTSYNSYGGSQTATKKSTTGSTNTSASTSLGKQVGSVDNTVGTKYLLSPKLETDLAYTSKLVLERVGRTYIASRTYIEAADAMTTNLENRIAFFATRFETYGGSVNSSVVTGKILGHMVEYPFSKVIIHAVQRSKFDELRDQSNSIGSAFITGLTADSCILGSTKLTDKQSQDNMTVLLRHDTIKQVEDVTLWMFDDGQLPSAWKALASSVEVARVKLAGEHEQEMLLLSEKK